MGAACAPSYACLHLGWWEKKVYAHAAFEKHVALWVCYIDDMLVVWRGSEQFGRFILDFSQNNRNIYLTFKVDPCK